MKKKVDERNLKKYISLIEKEVIDEEIKEKIIEKIKFYAYYGKLYVDKKDLYGTYVNKKDLNRATPAKEFLEIKIDNAFICNYSEWSNAKLVNIFQRTLKGGHTQIIKRERVDYRTYNNKNNNYEETIEKIYNHDKKLIYKSEKKEENDFETYLNEPNHIIYNNDSNMTEIEKRWYIQNGSIIKYNFNKTNFKENTLKEEIYSVCAGPIDGSKYYFDELSKELFADFMTGKISIDELLKETYKNEVKGHSLELIFGKKKFN